MIQKRKKTNSSRVNLIISFTFHSILVACIFYFAAKQGLLGKKLKELTVTMEKVKKPEPEKEKPPEPKIDQPKAQQAKVDVPQPKAVVEPPPAAGNANAPEVAPAAVALPSFGFNEGAIDVTSISDPYAIYKTLVEHALFAFWNRPQDMSDDSFVAEVELTIDKSGSVEDTHWLSGSGNALWDQSVKDAVARLKDIGRPPPKGFPNKFIVRFDVQSTKTDTLQFGGG